MTEDNSASKGDSWYEQLQLEEQLSFRTHKSGEIPPKPAWHYEVYLGQDHEVCFQKILKLVSIIINVARHRWPDEDWWRDILPIWFVQATPSYTQAEAEELITSASPGQWDKLPWDFGSWLETMQIREWRWWSYHRQADRMIIYLRLAGWPAQLDTFEHILLAAGANIVHADALP